MYCTVSHVQEPDKLWFLNALLANSVNSEPSLPDIIEPKYEL